MLHAVHYNIYIVKLQGGANIQQGGGGGGGECPPPKKNLSRKQNIGHMRKMCAGGIHMQYVCSLRTILKICAKYAQFAHIKKKGKKVQHRLLVTHPITGHAQCSRTVLSMWYGLRHL